MLNNLLCQKMIEVINMFPVHKLVKKSPLCILRIPCDAAVVHVQKKCSRRTDVEQSGHVFSSGFVYTF